MEVDKREGRIIFSTGKRVYAYAGIIGLGIEDGEFTLTYGYDGQIPDDDTKLTAEERRELADYMITLWQQYRGSIKD